MYGRVIFESIVLVVGLIFGGLYCFAQEGGGGEEESITVTTYYPSPYGVYNQLQTNRMAVGDTNGDGQLTALDLPNRDGDIRLKPQPGDPTSWPAGEEGQFAYSQVNDELYHYNGSAWVAQGEGEGTAVMYLSCAWGTDFSAGAGHGWDGSCTPPSCPSGWTSVATFSEPLSVACSGGDNCSWGQASSSDHPVVVGRSVRVCVK